MKRFCGGKAAKVYAIQEKTMSRNYKIANLRALAIIVVVLGHSIILYSDGWNLMPTSVHCEVLNKTKWLIDRFQMELYFMISGYLMWFSVTKPIPFMEFAKKKAVRLLLPYIAFGLCWMIPIKYALQIPTIQDLSLIQITERFFCGIDNGHLWFLYTLFILMTTLFPLNKVAKDLQVGGGYFIDTLYIMCVKAYSAHCSHRKHLAVCLQHIQVCNVVSARIAY